MALSPNYGFPEPDNSSLVKNGAQDIRALGDAIDTAIWNVGFGQAGKNRIINGDFGIWQRGTSFSNPLVAAYTADRWIFSFTDAYPTTYSITQQSFTPGTAPVAGYESQFFIRSTITTVGSSTVFRPFEQRIEDVRNFANQTMTVSFWAKSDSSRTTAVLINQNFGSGGSASVGSANQTFTTTTSWQRFSLSFAVPSVSGKTIGTSSYLGVIFAQAAASGSVLDIWGVQAEYGSKATPFETATGTIQGELAACQRYYQRIQGNVNTAYAQIAMGFTNSTTNAVFGINIPTMRVTPGLAWGNLVVKDWAGGFFTPSAISIDTNSDTESSVAINTTLSGATASRGAQLIGNNNTAAFLALEAEL